MTAVFLLLFVVQLAIYAFHELTEAGVLPLDNEFWHVATEPYGPEGIYGHWLSYGLVAHSPRLACLSPLIGPPHRVTNFSPAQASQSPQGGPASASSTKRGAGCACDF